MTDRSLVHEFRQRLLAAPAAPRRPPESQTSQPLKEARLPAARTVSAQPGNQARITAESSARAFGALTVAMLILAVFNSAALISYARDLVSSESGRQIYALSERWHGMMEDVHATEALGVLRQRVDTAREARWSDLARTLGIERFLARRQEARRPAR